MSVHEFVPFPITKDDKPGHVCKGGCACAKCSQNKGNREYHFQNRDRRRAEAQDGKSPASPVGSPSHEVLEG